VANPLGYQSKGEQAAFRPAAVVPVPRRAVDSLEQ